MQLDLLATEREESSLTFTAQAAGLPVEHRVDISPLALLGVAMITSTNGHAKPQPHWKPDWGSWDIVGGDK